MHYIICRNVHERAPLAKPRCCNAGRISCKPNTGALLSTKINHNDDSKSPNYCALLGTSTKGNNDSKSIGAGMDILAMFLEAIIVTFIVQLIKCDNDSNNGANHNI